MITFLQGKGLDSRINSDSAGHKISHKETPMKINVYAEEYVDERRTKFVKKTTAQGTQFCGVSVFLKSHKDLHDSETDDDRSAITFWSYDRKDNRKRSQRFYERLQSAAIFWQVT
ncbi:MAG TPA: hypothetical protein VKF81_14260 [Blastocatellia bacterium]|nr:hypothetical protein [Blastocatellia bacterium]